MRVLINAGPWLTVPPRGYGGIENVVATLIPELRRRGVHVVLATVGGSTSAADEVISVFDDPQFGVLQRPYNQVMGVAAAHMHRVATELAARDDIDLVHDHVEALGLTTLAALGPQAPPVLHTLHWDLAKHPQLYGSFCGAGRVFVNGVSRSQLARAPKRLREHSVGHVHLATPLAGRSRSKVGKSDHVVVLGRVTPGKGQHIAARLAHKHGFRLVLAGPVGPHPDGRSLDDAQSTPDVDYWRREVAEWVDGDQVRWVGTLPDEERDHLVASARATLFPLCWDEPGGTAVVESLALGTPVIGYRRGCLPELIDHGRTGVLVDEGDEDGLVAGLEAASTFDGDECARVAAARFSPAAMADRYLSLYEKISTGRTCH